VTTLVAAHAPPAPTQHNAAPVAIRIRELTKRFLVRRSWKQTLLHPTQVDYTPALDRVDCEVRRGEFFGLLGPNGAGKTTLFKILATLILPDEGVATVEGFDVERDAARVRRTLAPVITDERSLYWRLSADENLRLFAVLHGVPSGTLKQRIAELLHVVGLADLRAKPVGAYSSGMKQRLLLARALIAAPQVLLLDEPTRSLDPVTARDFRAFLRDEISGRQGCTVLLATHNTEEALGLCDRVAILNRGRLVATGVPAMLKEQFGDERYQLWTSNPVHPSFGSLAERGVINAHVVHAPSPDGWSIIEIDIPGGLGQVAHVLAFLVSRGAVIGRCERVDLSLADLIERALQHA